MIPLLLASLAVAAPQEVAELEWARVPPVTLATHGADDDPATRQAVARALGRLRTAESLPFLRRLADDDDPAVRREAARALALTPGSAEDLRAALDVTPPAAGFGGRAADADGIRVALIEGLGHQGDTDDVDRLVEILAEPWPYAAAAAHALGRLGNRDVHGVNLAIGPLVTALDRPDPRTRDAAAYALRRIGLGDASPDAVARALRALDGGASEVARAWLVRAVWPALDPDARTDLFIGAVTDASRLVQVATLQAAGPDLPSDIVAPFVLGTDPWVSLAALATLGRIGDEVALDALARAADGDDPWRAAAALAAAPPPDRRTALDPAADPRIRAALVGALPPADLLTLAEADAEPIVRTAAAATLLERGADAAVGVGLLESTDPLVREVAVELVTARAEPADAARALLEQVGRESDEGVLRATLAALTGLVEAAPKAVAPGRAAIDEALGRVDAESGARLRTAARALAAAMQIAWEPPGLAPAEAVPVTRGDGSTLEVAAGPPDLADVVRVRLARVETTRGPFTIALDPDVAPYAVANFARLADAGWFDDQVFHRVVPGFVVQTGCPRGDGWGGPGWTIPDEVSVSGFGTGAVGMARAEPDSGGSQWFVTLSPQPHLDGAYTRFGEVTQGLHVVRRLERGDQILSVTVIR